MTAKILAFDAETTYCNDPMPWNREAELVIYSVADGDNTCTYTFNHSEKIGDVFEIARLSKAVYEADLLVGHNMSLDLHWLTFLGIEWQDKTIYDTKIAQYMIDGQNKKLGDSLNELRARFNLPLKDEQIASMWKAGIQTRDIPYDILSSYCEADASTTLKIYNLQQSMIKVRGLSKLVSLHMELRKELCIAEYNGMAFDIQLAEDVGSELSARMMEIEVELRLLLDWPDINLNSSDQISCAMFGGTLMVDGEEWVIRTLKNVSKYYTRHAKVPLEIKGLGFKPPKGLKINDKGIYSTDAKTVLAALKPTNKKQKRFIDLLREYNGYAKQLSTYCDGLSKKATDGILHPRFHQTTTATGRLSSSSPNGQNVPRTGNAPVKKFFRSRYTKGGM